MQICACTWLEKPSLMFPLLCHDDNQCAGCQLFSMLAFKSAIPLSFLHFKCAFNDSLIIILDRASVSDD